MRTKNEKNLLAILVAILFAGGNYFGYQWLSHQQAGLELGYAQMSADRAEAEVDLQKADLWAQRKAWIGQHQPPLGEAGDASAQVLQYVSKGARDHKLEIMDQNPGDTQGGPSGMRVNVTVKVKGSMEDLCKWLADLQKPESFYAVSLFSLLADPDKKSMVCTLHIARYFKAGS